MNDEDQEHVMGNVAVGRTRRNSRKPNWLITDMIMTYALPVIEEEIPTTYRKVKSVQSSRCGRMPGWKR